VGCGEGLAFEPTCNPNEDCNMTKPADFRTTPAPCPAPEWADWFRFQLAPGGGAR
jgi:hypothetical protein